MPDTPRPKPVLSRRALLGRGTLALTTLGLAPAALTASSCGPAPARAAGDPATHDVRAYGAAGDGTADDTRPVHQAFTAAQRTGGEVLIPPGHYRITQTIPVHAPITVRGFGDTSVLKAAAAMPEILRVTMQRGGLFTDLTFSGDDLANRCVTQTVDKENSVGTRWVRCRLSGARDIQMVNHGCEDVTYLDCGTEGDESNTASIRDALSVYVPSGAVRIIGGEWFGRCTFNYQQVTITDATIGPLVIDNPDAHPDRLLTATGCYLYDGGTHADACVDTDTNLTNVHLSDCYLAASANPSYLNGHLPDVSIRVQDCIFTQPATAPEDYVATVLTASGAGQLVIDGGRAAPRPAGAIHALRTVGDSAISVATPVPCLGLT